MVAKEVVFMRRKRRDMAVTKVARMVMVESVMETFEVLETRCKRVRCVYLEGR